MSSKVVYFVLEAYDEVAFLEVPKVLHKEAWIYITDHTDYAIGAVAETFVSPPGEITSLREFLAHDLEEAIKDFWHRLWVEEHDFALDDVRALAKKREWGMIFNLILEIKAREIKAAAPYRIYTIPDNVPTLSGSLGPGSEIVVDRQTAAKMDESHLGREIPIEQMLSENYGTLGKLVGDFAHRYAEGRRILDRFAELEGEERG